MNQKILIALCKLIVTADFKSVEKKFMEQGTDKETVDEYIKCFKKLRDNNRIQDENERNIDYWGKKPFEEFSTFVDRIDEEKSKRQQKKTIHKEAQKIEGADLVAENDDWLVYHIKQYEASEKLGSRDWCIVRERGHWNSHAAKYAFYYYLSKNRGKDDQWFKIAKGVSLSNMKPLYWDNNDNPSSGASSVPSNLNLPATKDFFVKVNGKVTRCNSILELPENAELGELVLKGVNITKLPNGLKLDVLDLRGNKTLKELPPKISVKSIFLSDCVLNTLPQISDLHELNLRNSNDINLPDGLSVDRLTLQGSKLTKLPAGLQTANLDLSNTQITKLPSKLKVSSKLILSDSLITEIPGDLAVGILTLEKSKVTKLPNGVRIAHIEANNSGLTNIPYIQVLEGLEIENAPIEELPDKLNLTSDLDLTGTKITKLPKKLTIAGSLTLNDKITELPNDLDVSTRIYITEGQLVKEIPKHLKSKIREFH